MTLHRTMSYGALLAALMLSGCVVVPAHGPDYVVAPALPVIVELGVEPYYVHDGYYYYYHESTHRWTYSRDRAGPWKELPRDRYPREIRYRDRDRERWHEQERDRRD